MGLYASSSTQTFDSHNHMREIVADWAYVVPDAIE